MLSVRPETERGSFRLNSYHTAVPLQQVLKQGQNSLETSAECPLGWDGSLRLSRLKKRSLY